MGDIWGSEREEAQAWVDHSTLRGESSGTDTRYTVTLKGIVDDRWVEAYRLVQAESTGYRRFRFDRAAGTICFSCRTVDGTALVFEVLDRLEKLLGLVNEQVETWRSQAIVDASASGPRGFA